MGKIKPKAEECHEILARRLFNRLVSKDTVESLFALVEEGKTDEDTTICQAALNLMKDISLQFPSFFGNCFEHLGLVDDINDTVCESSPLLFSLFIPFVCKITKLLENLAASGTLSLFSSVIRFFPKQKDADKSVFLITSLFLITMLTDRVISGHRFIRATLEKKATEEDPTAAESATVILLNLNGADSSVKKLFQFVMDNLLPISSSENTPLLNSLAILHQMVSASHQLVAAKEDEISTFLTSLIRTNSVRVAL